MFISNTMDLSQHCLEKPEQHELVLFGKTPISSFNPLAPGRTTTYGTPIKEVEETLQLMRQRQNNFLRADHKKKQEAITEFFTDSRSVDVHKEEKAMIMIQGIQNALGGQVNIILPFLKFTLAKAKEKKDVSGDLFVQYVQDQFSHEIEKNVLTEAEFLAHILNRHLLNSNTLMEQLFKKEVLQESKYYEKNTEKQMSQFVHDISMRNFENEVQKSKDFFNIVSAAEAYGILDEGLTIVEQIQNLDALHQTLQDMLPITNDEYETFLTEFSNIKQCLEKLHQSKQSQEKNTENYEDTLRIIIESMKRRVLHDNPHEERSVLEHISAVLHYLQLNPEKSEDRDSFHTLFSAATHHDKEYGAREKNLLMQLQVSLGYLSDIVDQYKNLHGVEIEMKVVFQTLSNIAPNGAVIQIDAWHNGKRLTKENVIDSTKIMFESLMSEKQKANNDLNKSRRSFEKIYADEEKEKVLDIL